MNALGFFISFSPSSCLSSLFLVFNAFLSFGATFVTRRIRLSRLSAQTWAFINVHTFTEETSDPQSHSRLKNILEDSSVYSLVYRSRLSSRAKNDSRNPRGAYARVNGRKNTSSCTMLRSVTPTMKLIGLVILAVLHSPGSNSQEANCSTASKQSGTCINIRQCPALMSVLRGPRPLSPQALELLRSSQCGFDGNSPKVCCESERAGTTSPLVGASNDEDSASPPSPPDVTAHPNLRLLEHALCGPITQGKILNGNKTSVFDYPWMALIAYKIGSTYEFRCGGSVINKRYILTAAHCVSQLPAGLVLSGVRVGDHDISKERDCDKGEDGLEVVCAERYQDFGVESTHPHPRYSRSNLKNDIALIRIDNDADFRPASVRPICLPIGAAATIVQKKVTVTGWGATERGPQSQDLLQAFISVVPNEQCAEAYRKTATIGFRQLCAGGSNGVDSCFGDSGGPLQSPGLYNSAPKYIQHGLVSFGPTRCGIEGFPGVYTKLSYYLDWVLDTMRD
ncbi:melanization protease 1-like isoform X2 [Venturia canescens]|uniref:melanization protease 1-like isoform X2 n=1 Tax=Venturia canescens TaxID=32260 RepID=UPI001C9CFE51|nr:melanization protease 1-like isoform X2 [Venturia canescens]